MASVILVPVVPVALVAEAVRPVPGPISPAQVGDDDTRGEVLDLPRAGRERCGARARHPIEVHMTERDVVARAWWNERYVSDDRCSGGGVRIDNFGADGDLLQGRYRERAEPAREPRVLAAVLLSVEGSGTRGVLAVVVRIAAGGNHAEIFCLAHRGHSILCATPGAIASFAPPPLMVATTVAGPGFGARMAAAGKTPGSFLGAA